VHHQAVTDQIVRANPLDPIAAIIFVAAFVAAALLTARRPAFGLCTLLVAIPFALYRDLLGTTVTLPKVALLGVVVGLTTFRDRLPSFRAIPVRTFLIAAVCLIGATALSIAQADVHTATVREVLKTAEYALAFLVAYACFKLDPDEELVGLAIAAVVSAVALGALWQETGNAPSGMYFNNVIVPRIAGALEGPNQLAGYLEIGVAVLAAFACARPRWEFSVALGFAVLADILTFSRSGLIGSAVSIAVVAFVYRRVAIRLVAPLATALLAGAATTAGWATSAHVSTANVLRISGNGDFVSGTTYAGGVGSRSELWRAALALWKQHPLFGVGAGNFELDLPRVGLFGVRTHANSLYIQALVEGGIPLLAATLFFVWTSIASFVRRASASPLVTAALAASIALALHQTVDFVVFYPKVGEMWWIVLALGAACV
jgi:hypothetical protein